MHARAKYSLKFDRGQATHETTIHFHFIYTNTHFLVPKLIMHFCYKTIVIVSSSINCIVVSKFKLLNMADIRV